MEELTSLSKAVEDEIQRRQREDEYRKNLDIVEFAHSNFYIEETAAPIVLSSHQQAVIRYPFRRLREGDPRIVRFPSLAVRLGHFPFTTVIESTIKKGGKTTLSAVVVRYIMEIQSRFGEIYTLGNDMEQALERAFKFLTFSIRLTPGCIQRGSEWILPGRFTVQKTKVECLTSGTVVKPVSVDARGEAGGNPDLTCWTELWGFEQEEAKRFWHEMTPVPTKIDSIRLVETYAGYDGESEILKELYDLGMSGRQLTAGELAEATNTPLEAFEETQWDPEAPVPVYVNEAASLFMYWDEGELARRMPWQRGPLSESYYREQSMKLPPAAYTRLHENKWTGGESEFIPVDVFDACREDLPRFEPETAGSVVLACDAATTGDCFGIVAVTRHPNRHEDVAIRRVRKWDPKESGGQVNYAEPERFLRALCKGACAAGHPRQSGWQVPECVFCREGPFMAPYKVVQIAYDPYQLESMMQSLRR